MTEIRLERSKVEQIRDELPSMSATLEKGLTSIVSNLEVIRKNIDSDGINTILSKFDETVNGLVGEITKNLNTAHDYLERKLKGYEYVASKTEELMEEINANLEKGGY